MACRYDGESCIFQLRPAPLGHCHSDVGVELSPDELDRYIECLELWQMLRIAGEFIEELRRQLHKGGTSAGLSDEVVADQRSDERIQMVFLRFGQSILE